MMQNTNWQKMMSMAVMYAALSAGAPALAQDDTMQVLEDSAATYQEQVVGLTTRIDTLQVDAACRPSRLELEAATVELEQALDGSSAVIEALEGQAQAHRRSIEATARDLRTLATPGPERDAQEADLTRAYGWRLLQTEQALMAWRQHALDLRSRLDDLTVREVVLERGCELGWVLDDMMPPQLPAGALPGTTPLAVPQEHVADADGVVDGVLREAGLR